jgi:hypothetical protein
LFRLDAKQKISHAKRKENEAKQNENIYAIFFLRSEIENWKRIKRKKQKHLSEIPGYRNRNETNPVSLRFVLL